MQLFTRFFAIAAAATPFIAQAAPFASRPANEVVPGKWIIQLRPDSDAASIGAHYSRVRDIRARNLARRTYGYGPLASGVERDLCIGNFKAYAGSFDDRTIEELRAMPEVLVVEQDYIMTTSALVTREMS
jgi:oryzin